MIKNKKDRANVCQRLIELGGRFGRIWTVDGPIAGTESDWTWDQRLLYRVALDFWDRTGKVSILELTKLENPKLGHAIGDLMVAVSSASQNILIERWLKKHDARQTTFKAEGFKAIQS